MEAPEAYLSHPPAPNCYRSSVPIGYGEDAFEGRTTLGEGCVLAHRGWAGENGDFFSSLLMP